MNSLNLSSNAIYWLDFVADTYTPLLLLVAVLEIYRSWKKNNRAHLLYFIYAVTIVYALMFADARWSLWASWGLDYSTHSAAAFCLVVIMCLYKGARTWVIALSTLIAYGLLMHILNYHSWMDMFTSVFACTVGLLPLSRARGRRLNGIGLGREKTCAS
ncbi:hypothetical protein [Cellvibrio zantedeschiae]|uniref:hypothetical protein n=1 Tax=Cellvibrio zantedeschiae TaxID=1237077 RepID=UPI00167A5B09|nr:hypothetical protein [Cellvibrio zantedeschiae]